MLKSTVVIFGLLGGIIQIYGQFPKELDDRFLEQRKEGFWLVEFYAPWCGHCKQLEPTYKEVVVQLRDTPINVCKLDATYLSHVAKEFDVKGFPTIMFFGRGDVYTYRGDRSLNNIVEFAKRALGPPVRHLSSIGKFNEAKEDRFGASFFLYVGDEDPNDDLYKTYSLISQKKIVESYFYSGKKNILPQSYTVNSVPAVLVFKDDTYFEYQGTCEELAEWIDSEKFLTFPRVNGADLNEMVSLNKLVVITVIDEQDTEQSTRQDRLKEITKTLAFNKRTIYHKNFQFTWTSDTQLISDIVMWTISTPNILILDPAKQTYYMPEGAVSSITIQEMEEFLRNILDGKTQPLGGTSFIQRLKRVFYDLFSTLISIWQSSRWLFLLIFGLPSVLISVVCYVLCCASEGEGVREEEWSDSEDEDGRPIEGIEEEEDKKNI